VLGITEQPRCTHAGEQDPRCTMTPRHHRRRRELRPV
jgi:hypothetical protein